MKKKRVTNIDFADSEFKSYEMSGETLTLKLISWDEKLLKIVFLNCIQFSFKLGDFIADLYEIEEEISFLKEALSRYYVEIENEHPFKLFQLYDIQDFPFIEVVAESVKVTKENIE